MCGTDLESLMLGYSQGKDGCEAELGKMVLKRLYQHITRRMGAPKHRGNIDDVVNETAVPVMQQVAAGKLPRPGRAEAWLAGVAAKATLNYHRRWFREQQRIRVIEDAEIEREAYDDETGKRVENEELVAKALAELSPVERTIAIGIARDLSTKEMVERTGLKRATYFRAKTRLVIKLKERLAELCSLLVAMCGGAWL